MKPFDMNNLPRTSMKFIRALCEQSAALGRVEDITAEDAAAYLGFDGLNASHGPQSKPQEDPL
jgi:hypothetical protein